MATTYTDNGGGAANGSDLEFTFTFPVIQTEDVKVALNNIVQATTKYAVNLSSNPTKITFNNTSIDSSVQESSGAPKSDVRVRVYRETTVGKTSGDDDPKAVFAAGSSIRAVDLNANVEQSLYAIHELQTRPVETEDIQNDAITSDKIADDQINSEHYVDGSIDTQHIAADQITSALIADDQINSEHYVDASIDEQHIANSAVTSIKIADNSVTTTEILNGAVTTAKLAADAIDGTKLADNAVDSEHYTDGSIDRVHLEADIIDSTKLADNAVNSEHYVDGSIDRVHLEADIIDSTKLADDAVGAEHIQANAVTDSEIATGTLDNRYFTETELTGGALDGRYFTETESDARYFNISTGDTIKDGDSFPDNDTTIATTAAINDRIIDLVDDVGGFVPIANETSFPNANPDVNNGTGTLVSIKALSQNLTSNGSGQISISNGTVGNSTVTITGAANSTTYAATFGMIVETTTTLNTYTFHRLVPKATEVSTVSGSIGNINTVGNAISNVNAVAGNATNINTVAANNTNVTNVGSNISNVNAVHANATNINTVAGINANVTTVAGISSNVTSVAGNTSNINSAVSNASNINSAVSNASNINTVAGSISNVNTTATNIASVNTTASNIINVNNFTDKYQIASNNPSTDGGGNALAAGDLYFNTSANELKVYNGSAWQGGVTASGSFASTTGNTFTGDNRYNDNVKALFGTGNDLEIYHSGSASFISDVGTGDLNITGNSVLIKTNLNEAAILAYANQQVELFYDNSKKFETTSSGSTLSGNLLLDSASAEINLKAGNIGSTGAINWTFNSANTNYASINVPYDTRGTDGLIVDGGSYSVSLKHGSEYLGKFIADGAVELYHNNSKKLETTSGGALVTGNFYLNDNGELTLGTGGDLKIYHDGTNSRIHSPSHNLYIRSGGDFAVFNGGGSETMLLASPNGAVELYYDNSKRLETTSAGVHVLGTLEGDNFKVSNPGNNAVLIQNPSNGIIGFGANNQTNQVVITTAGDLLIPNDSGKMSFGASEDLKIYHDGSVNFIDSPSHELRIRGTYVALQPNGGGEQMALGTANAAFELYYDGSKKFETTSLGTKVTGRINVTGNFEQDDNVKANWGNSHDLQIYHDGSNSVIDNNTGNLYIQSASSILIQGANNENVIKYNANGAVELYYDNSKKFETTSYGISIGQNAAGSISGQAGIEIGQGHTTSEIRLKNTSGGSGSADGFGVQKWSDGNTYIFEYDPNNFVIGTNGVGRWIIGGTSGNLIPYSNNTVDIGTSTTRVRNIYTNDLNLSNEGSTNSVDNTWGNYTIQEGESDLYLINNRNGKKYKFNLTEVN